jgi:hypothetical protein
LPVIEKNLHPRCCGREAEKLRQRPTARRMA